MRSLLLRGWKRVASSKISGVIFVIIPLLVLWEYLATVTELASFPRASDIAIKWVELVLSGEILAALVPTFRRIAIGYALATTLAIPLGVLMGFSKVAFNLLEPLTESLRPIPASALVPLLIIFLGIGDEMNIGLISFASFFPILLNTYAGVRGVDPVLTQTARTLGHSGASIVWRVRFPAAMPYIFTGLRISLAISLVLAVIAEMLAGNSGIGFFTIQAQRGFRVTTMYAGIFTLGVVGYLFNRIFVLFERRVLRWHLGYSEVQT
jgi:ABC-type nitrate/sulfonate/bicarbonate transport system permease component